MAEQNQEQLIAKAGEFNSFPEAGGVAWIDIFGKKKDANGVMHVIKVSLTSRAETPYEALHNLMDAVEVASNDLNLRPYPPTIDIVTTNTPCNASSSSAPMPPSSSAMPSQYPVAPAMPSQVPVAPTAPQAQQNGGVVHAITMQVEPKAGGKTTLKFFAPNRKYADIYATNEPGFLAGLLKDTGAWTAEHFQVPGEYAVAYDVAWVESENRNSHGKPYKNITSITLRK